MLQLREEIRTIRLALEGFQTIFPGSATVADKVLSDLEALPASAGCGSDYVGFYKTAGDRFSDATNLTNAVEVFKRAKLLGILVEVISRDKSYLDNMRFGPDRQNLALERDALTARSSLPIWSRTLRYGPRWKSICARFASGIL